MFVLQNNEPASLANLGLMIEPLDDRPRGQSAFFELTLAFGETANGFQGALNFNTDLFRTPTIQRMIQHYRVLLAEAVADPRRGCRPCRCWAKTSGVRCWWIGVTQSGITRANVRIDDMFEAQVRKAPDAVAIIDAERQWTYRQLDERANQLAHCLQSRGVGPDHVVAVRLPRSAELIAALWGVLKAGGAYLPLDPQLPAERLRFTLEDAKVDVVVTLDGLRGDLPEGPRHVVCIDADREEIEQYPTHAPPRPAATDHLAYIIYTSGSTGRPKGVMIEHRALVNYTHAVAEEYGITAADRVLQFASVSYDAHVEEVYPCLTHGGTLVLRNEEMLDSRRFWRQCDEWRVTFVTVPTGFWHELIDATRAEKLAVPESLRLLVIGGEAALPERVAAWFDCLGNRVRLLNTYGPTETTVVATVAEMSRANGREERVPIGRPLANYRAYVLDRTLQPVPAGVRGELYIGGASLARGYLNRPELTAERFIADPFAEEPGARMYKTGDVVRWRADGRIEFVGRTDHQVKIRGFRIEPGEVEQVLREHPLLADAAVVARQRSPGDLQLVAYTVGRDGDQPTAAEMRQFLRERLPEFMIPSAFVPIEAMPMTTSGKADRRALPEPDWSGGSPQGEFDCPQYAHRAAISGRVVGSAECRADRRSRRFLQSGRQFALGLAVGLARAAGVFGRSAADDDLYRADRRRAVARDRDLAGGRAEGRTAADCSGAARSAAAGLLRPGAVLVRAADVAHSDNPQHARGAADYRRARRGRLRDTINEIIWRHEALRTTFAMTDAGELVQVILPELRIELPIEDLGHLPEGERRQEMQRLSLQQAGMAFDLAARPPFHVRLLRLSDVEHVLLVTTHHVICDGWSLEVLTHEVAQIYDAFRSGRPPRLPPLPIQYADFAVWQRNYMQGEVLEKLLDYWRNKLEGLATLELPTDRPRLVAAQHVEKIYEFLIPHRLKIRLDAAVQRGGRDALHAVAGGLPSPAAPLHRLGRRGHRLAVGQSAAAGNARHDRPVHQHAGDAQRPFRRSEFPRPVGASRAYGHRGLRA